MNYFKHIFFISTVSLLLASCGSYGVISDNDVYLQKPAAIDLTDDQDDITSFNAYKAGRDGAYQRGDKRLENTNARAFATYNARFMFGTYYNPFHYYYPTDPFIWGRPYYFSYGLNSPLYGMNTYYAPGFGYGYGSPYYGFGSPMSYYHHNNFFGSGFYPYHNNFNSIYGNSGNTSYFGSGSSNQFYGPRTPLAGSSRRSSSNPESLKSKTYGNNYNKPYGQTVNSKKLSTQNIKNRRKVSNTEREYVRSNNDARRNISTSENYTGSNRNGSASAANNRRSSYSSDTYRNRSYSPSNTARRSGTVNRSNIDRRTSGTYNSSNSDRRGSYSSGNNSRGSSFSSSPQRSSGSSMNRSTGSSSRTSGSSSSRGGSSNSGRR